MSNNDDVVDIEEVHQQSLLEGSSTYIDPSTGYTVFTSLAHLKRGHCCGSKCRHCPYGWVNVSSGVRRKALVESGNKAEIEKLLSQLKDQKRKAERTKKQPDPDNKDKGAATTTPETRTGGRFGGTHTRKNVPYTRGGDYGTSQLLTGERRSKADQSFEAMGTVDELCSTVGVVYAHFQQELRQMKQQQQQEQHSNGENDKLQTRVEDLDEWMLDIMSRLFDIGSHLAKPKPPKHDDDDDSESSEDESGGPRFVADGIGGGFHHFHVTELEEAIDKMTEDLPELTSFLLPASSSVAVASSHVVRTVCRRAERCVIPLVTVGSCDPNALSYLNRLSDFWFTAARWIHRYVAQQPSDVEYKRPHRGAKQRDRTNIVVEKEAQ